MSGDSEKAVDVQVPSHAIARGIRELQPPARLVSRHQAEGDRICPTRPYTAGL